ncbi:hypothetical protein LguiA_023667 [Lonicera macranthoides]
MLWSLYAHTSMILSDRVPRMLQSLLVSMCCVSSMSLLQAIAYNLDQKQAFSKGEKIVLISDLGGGTCNVSLLSINRGIAARDTHLGGKDFNNQLVNHSVEEFKRNHGKDISDPRTLRRLSTECEKAMRRLFCATRTIIVVDSLCEVELCLGEIGFEKGNVDEVVLVGGSTKTPKVQQVIEDVFKGKKIHRSKILDMVVAHGAAVHVAILNGEQMENLFLLDGAES